MPGVILSHSPGCTCCPEREAPCNECTRRPNLLVISQCVNVEPTDCSKCIGGSETLTWDSANQIWEFSIPASPALRIRCRDQRLQMQMRSPVGCNGCVFIPGFFQSFNVVDTCVATRGIFATWIDAESYTCSPTSAVFRLPACSVVTDCQDIGGVIVGQVSANIPELEIVVFET